MVEQCPMDEGRLISDRGEMDLNEAQQLWDWRNRIANLITTYGPIRMRPLLGGFGAKPARACFATTRSRQ